MNQQTDQSSRPEGNAPGGSVVAIIGAGVMGSAIADGLLRAGHRPSDVVLSDGNRDRLDQLEKDRGVRTAGAGQAAAEADTVLLAVKPYDVGAVLDEIAATLRPGAVVVSVAAGITTADLEARLPAGTPVVRAMPNTPALVGEGMSAISAGSNCGVDGLRRAEELLATCGKVLTVPEKHLDAVTAISGSGPAYVFYVAEAMIEGGVLLGMPRPQASELVVQTLLGAATMLAETGDHPSLLRERVSSPGGTTIAALRQLDDHRVRAAVVTAMESAARRSAELAQHD